jgi:DNA-binding transcriptional ArsR family regulator
MFDGDRMNSLYSIQIEYSPAYELVVSFYACINHKNLKSPQLGSEWLTETMRKLPAAFAQELKDERWEVLHRTVLLISQCPHKETAEAFLRWLEQLPAGELYERLAPWVSSIPLHLGEIRDRSVYLLSQWNEHYFRDVDPVVLQKLQEDAVLRAEQAKSHPPVELIEEVTNGMRIEPTGQLKQVVLAPQYHCRPATVLDFFRGMATCLYPLQAEEDETSHLLALAQCLADPKRLRILRYIAEKPRTLGEIHRHVGLAKSTVHHHITALRRAGMIRGHYLDHTTAAYYSLRESFVELLNARLRHFLSVEEKRDE